MATSLTAKILASLSWNYQETDDFGTRGKSNDGKKYTLDITEGTWLYRARRTVAPSSLTDDLDLSGVLDDVLNLPISATKVLFIAVFNLSDPDTDTGNDLLVGGAGAANKAWAEPWAGNQDAQSHVAPGGLFLHAMSKAAEAWNVIAGSNDVLRVEWDGTTGTGDADEIDYEIILAGL